MQFAGVVPRFVRFDMQGARRAALVTAAVVCTGGVAVLLAVGPSPALAAMLVAASIVLIALAPQAATLVTAVLLYTNVPAILTKEHGVSPAAAGAFIFLLAIPIAHAVVVRRERLRFDATLGLMLAFLAILLLSALGAVNERIAVARVEGYVVEGLLLYWLVVNAVRDLATLRNLLWAVLAAASLLSVLSLYQDLSGAYGQEFGGLAHRRYDADPAPGREEAARRRQARAQGPVEESNRFAQILIVLVPIAVYLYRNATSRRLRLLAACLGLLTLVGVLLTLSRGAFVTLLLLAIVMARIRWVRPWHVLAGVLAAAAFIPIVSPFFQDRLTRVVNVRHLLGNDPSAYRKADGAIRGRATEMLVALAVFRDHPWLGVGPGQFAPFYFPKYVQRADIKFRDLSVPRRAHNLYLELASEYGALGLGMFLAIVGCLMRRLWRARRSLLGSDREGADLLAALWLSLSAYLCSGMFLHLSYERYFWLLMALASVALHVTCSRRRVAHAAAA